MHAEQAALPYWRLSSFYFFCAALIGGLIPYWGLYLKHLGYEEQAIGSLMATLMGTQVLAPYLWGYLADRSGQRLRLIRLGVWLALLCFTGVFGDSGYGWLGLVMLGFGFFWNAILPQFEAVTLSYLREQPTRYSHIRLWGSIGFIASVVTLGWLLDVTDPSLLPGFVWGMLVLVMLASYTIGERETRSPAQASGSFFAALKHPQVLAFFVTCFLMQASHGPYATFFSIHMENHDYSRTAIGLLWSLGTAVEVGVFLFMHRLLERYALRSILLLSLSLAILRWWLIGTFPEYLTVMLFAQCLHGATFGSFHASAIEMVRRFFQGSHAGQGQAFYSSASIGLGSAVGAYYSGLSWQSLGAMYTYWIASILALLAIGIIWRWGSKPANHEVCDCNSLQEG